jgi:hypothetical protein
MFPKLLLRRKLQEVEPPDLSAPDEPHCALADLGLPVYITTNSSSATTAENSVG